MAALSISPQGPYGTELVYEGNCSIEWSDPDFILRGLGKVTYSETGTSHIEMHTDGMDAATASQFDSALQAARFSKFVVTCEVGYFVTEAIFGLQIDKRFLPESGEYNARICFQARDGQFCVSDPVTASYWVMPLTNFISRFMELPEVISRHPLYLRREVPNISVNRTPEESMDIALRMLHIGVIPFNFADDLAFIQPLHDYEVREHRLTKEIDRQRVTALMVGSIGGNQLTGDPVQHWIPLDFLPLLSVATGAEVSMPWIEYRDIDGNLVMRSHLTLYNSIFSTGHVALRTEYHDGAISRLLDSCQTAPHFGGDSLRVVARHTVRAGLAFLNIEDRLSHVFRALDCLCDAYQIAIENLLSGLDTVYREEVQKEISRAAGKMRSIAGRAEAAGDTSAKTLLQRIGGGITRAVNADVKFGDAVVKLLSHPDISLHDADILNPFFASNPHSGGARSWAGVIATVRAQVLHDGYLKPDANFAEALVILEHLNDLLIRIVLRLTLYTGEYQPVMKKLLGRFRVDWVNTGMAVEELGFSSKAGS